MVGVVVLVGLLMAHPHHHQIHIHTKAPVERTLLTQLEADIQQISQPSHVTTWSLEQTTEGDPISASPVADSADHPRMLWKLPIGCDFSGFFVEFLGIANALTHQLDLSLDFGRCSQATLSKLRPTERHVIEDLQSRDPITPKHCEVVVQHAPMDAVKPKSEFNGYVVARVMTESFTLTSNDIRALESVDEIWAPSRFHKDLFSQYVNTPVTVIGEAADPSFFSPTCDSRCSRVAGLTSAPHPLRGKVPGLSFENRIRSNGVTNCACSPESVSPSEPSTAGGAWRSDDMFVFVSVFKWEYRKGWDVLINSFWKAFDDRQSDSLKPVLLLRSYVPSWENSPSDIAKVVADLEGSFRERMGHRSGVLPKVVWIDQELSRDELRDLYWMSDCFVLPTRGEGWGLPITEAMASGLPVITTNAMGVTEYATDTNAYLLDYSVMKAPASGLEIAEPNAETLVTLMQSVRKDRVQAVQKGQLAAADMARRFSDDEVAKSIADRVRDISKSCV